MNQEKNWDISLRTILKIVLVIILIYFLYLIRSIILWFVFALVISILFEPAIELLTKRKIPRTIAVILIYILFLGILAYSIYYALPFFIFETYHFSQFLAEKLPIYLDQISPLLNNLGLKTSQITNIFIGTFKQPFNNITNNALDTLILLLGGFFAIFFIIGMAFFLSLENKIMEKILLLIFPKRHEVYIFKLWNKSKERVVGWFLMRIIGVMFALISSYLAFIILGINYPFSLAALFGAFDFVPIIGPAIAATFIFIVVSMENVETAILVLVLLGLFHFIENFILLPFLSKKIIKISPVIVLIALFVGGKLWGVIGALIAVPLFAILFEFLKDFLREKKENLF